MFLYHLSLAGNLRFTVGMSQIRNILLDHSLYMIGFNLYQRLSAMGFSYPFFPVPLASLPAPLTVNPASKTYAQCVRILYKMNVTGFAQKTSKNLITRLKREFTLPLLPFSRSDRFDQIP